jgi:hypothetical protein
VPMEGDFVEEGSGVAVADLVGEALAAGYAEAGVVRGRLPRTHISKG